MTRKRKPQKRGRVCLLLLLLLLFRLWLDNRTLITQTYTVCGAVPAAFDGCRIAMVSDLHGNARLYDRLLRHLRACEPDLIAITGDLSDDPDQWEGLEPLLRQMTEIAPCYYVSGNHEWAFTQPEDFFRRLTGCGVTLLRNDSLRLERDGAAILLVGVEDPNGYADMESPAALMRRVRQASSEYAVVLCHRPGLFPELASQGADLVLSGHNHGGLVRLPFAGGLVSPGGWLPEYDKCLFSLGDSQMLVSPGLCAVFPFPRVFNRLELSVAVLTAADS